MPEQNEENQQGGGDNSGAPLRKFARSSNCFQCPWQPGLILSNSAFFRMMTDALGQHAVHWRWSLVFRVLNGFLGISCPGHGIVLMVDDENLPPVHSDFYKCFILL